MYKALNIIICIIFFNILFACKKNVEEDYTNTDQQKYVIDTVILDDPIDLNLDGIYSQNIFNEIPSLKNSLLIINNRFKTINIIWQEPRINNGLIGNLPPIYQSDMAIKFYPVQNLFLFERNGQDILPYQNLENIRYTFKFPEIIFKKDNNNLFFKANLSTLTPAGIKVITIECIYVKM